MSQQQAPYSTGSKNDRDSTEINSDPVTAYLATLSSKGGRLGQERALDRMAVLLGYANAFSLNWPQLSPEQMASLPEKLLAVYSPVTVNRYIGALKGVLIHAYLLGQMPEEDYQQAIKLKRMDEPAPEGRILSYEEISALMRVCDDGTQVGARDAAIIALLYAAGLRPTELTDLQMKDFENQTLTITNGRDDERKISLHNGALEALQAWLVLRGSEAGPLFFAFRQGDHMQKGTRIFWAALSALLSRRAKAAGIGKVSPGDLRETFIMHLLGAGVDIVLICRLTGIRDVRTIARYDRRGVDALDAAVKLLQVPYRQSE